MIIKRPILQGQATVREQVIPKHMYVCKAIDFGSSKPPHRGRGAGICGPHNATLPWSNLDTQQKRVAMSRLHARWQVKTKLCKVSRLWIVAIKHHTIALFILLDFHPRFPGFFSGCIHFPSLHLPAQSYQYLTFLLLSACYHLFTTILSLVSYLLSS